MGNNVLFACGHTFLYVGSLRFLGRRERRGPLNVGLAIYSLVMTYLTFVNDDVVLRRAVLYLVLAALAFLNARAVFRYKTRFVTASANFLAGVFLAHGLVLMANTLLIVTNPPLAGVTATTPEQVVAILETLITTSLLTFGFIILVNQRLSAESHEARDNLELIFNTNPDAVLITRVTDGYFVRVNDGFTALTGYTRADVLGKSTRDINIWKNPADRQRMITALNATGECDNLEAVFQRKDGRELSGMVSAKILKMAGVPHILSVTRDITDRKRMEEALQLSEARHRLLAENARDVIWVMGLDGSITYVSPAVEQMRGLTPAEAMQQPIEEILTPASLAIIQAYFQKLWAAAQAGQPLDSFRGEIEYRHKDGSTLWTEVIAFPVPNSSGGFMEILGVTRDIRERKRSEEALRKLSRAVEQSPSTIVITNLAGDIEYANPKFTQTTGYTLAEALGKNPRILKSEHTSSHEYKQLWETITAGGEWRGELQNKKKNAPPPPTPPKTPNTGQPPPTPPPPPSYKPPNLRLTELDHLKDRIPGAHQPRTAHAADGHPHFAGIAGSRQAGEA